LRLASWSHGISHENFQIFFNVASWYLHYSLIIAGLEIGEYDLKNCSLMCDELGLCIVIHVSDMEVMTQGFRL